MGACALTENGSLVALAGTFLLQLGTSRRPVLGVLRIALPLVTAISALMWLEALRPA